MHTRVRAGVQLNTLLLLLLLLVLVLLLLLLYVLLLSTRYYYYYFLAEIGLSSGWGNCSGLQLNALPPERRAIVLSLLSLILVFVL